MAYETCPNCGSRVYKLGCLWCDEEAYIAKQERENEGCEASWFTIPQK